MITADKPIDQVLFSQEKPIITPAPDDISSEEYSSFRNRFISRYSETTVEDIVDLPHELKIFIKSISDLSPTEKLIAIEEYVRKISYYDFDNREVMRLKSGKDNDERLAIMQLRLDDLHNNGVNTDGKMFAGVCADFAMLTTALLRKAGFVSGVITGLSMNGKRANSSNSHGLSFVVWPSADDKTEIHVIDGTPVNNSIYESIRDRVKHKKEDINSLIEDAEGRLKDIEKIIASFDIEKIKLLSNGELEEILNVLLKYGVKRKNLHVIESILNTKYSPIKIAEMDLDDMSNVIQVTKLIDQETTRERKSDKKFEGIDLDSGKKLFETIQEFINRFSNREPTRFAEAINRIEKIFKISERFLEPTEAKVVFATINYLKAKRMLKT